MKLTQQTRETPLQEMEIKKKSGSYNSYQIQCSFGELEAFRDALALHHADPLADQLFEELSWWMAGHIPLPGEEKSEKEKHDEKEEERKAAEENAEEGTELPDVPDSAFDDDGGSEGGGASAPEPSPEPEPKPSQAAESLDVDALLAEPVSENFGPLASPALGSRGAPKRDPILQALCNLDKALMGRNEAWDNAIESAMHEAGVDNLTDLYNADPNLASSLVRKFSKTAPVGEGKQSEWFKSKFGKGKKPTAKDVDNEVDELVQGVADDKYETGPAHHGVRVPKKKTDEALPEPPALEGKTYSATLPPVNGGKARKVQAGTRPRRVTTKLFGRHPAVKNAK